MKKYILFLLTGLISHIAFALETSKDSSIFTQKRNDTLVNTNKETPVMSENYYEIILFVADQQKSKNFYSLIFQKQPDLDVSGMTEFNLADNLKLGLMPESGKAKMFADKMPLPSSGNGIPRCELYIHTGNVEELFNLAIKAGAKEISKIQDRDWGDTVGYVADLDGHIIAFARQTN